MAATQKIDRSIHKEIIKRNFNIMDNLSVLTAIKDKKLSKIVNNTKKRS
jgi:hypothetical protein